MTLEGRRRRRRAAAAAAAVFLVAAAAAVAVAAPSSGVLPSWLKRPPALGVEVSELTAPWSTDVTSRRTFVTVTGSGADPVTLTIDHDGRRILTFESVSNAETVDFWIKKKYAGGRWSVTATVGDASVTAEIPVALHWAPMGDPARRFEPCGTVGWFLDDHGEPAGGEGIEVDIASALSQLGAASGLNFARVTSKEGADFVYSWVSMTALDNAGIGGFRISDHGDYQGFVELNSQSEWVTRPGFDYVDGEPGRGVLVLHETGHALGLGHVGDVSQVMNTQADSGGPTALADGDRAGLARLYRPDTCPD